MDHMWAKKCFSRLLIDNHITEDDPRFMAGFDPAEYVAMVKKAGVDSAMVYACCHNGNCYYPTKVGHMHDNLKGRDIFRETVCGLKKAGIAAIAYYTVIHHNRSAIDNPQWTMVDAVGAPCKDRYWHCCPNSQDALEFYKAQMTEVVEYEVDGIFVDMTFWAKVCCCENCRKRYHKETGAELPKVIDWNDPQWVTFQRYREEWMAECAQAITDNIKKSKPNITVVHQFSPVLAGWLLGQCAAIAQASDYPSGDFYGGRNQHRLGVKVFDAFRHNNMPVEFMTSRCVNLYDHTSMKSAEELFCSAVTTLAHGGAYCFIDAINPDGTLESSIYERLGEVSAKARPFTDTIKRLMPDIQAEVGLYFSMESNDDEQLNGMPLIEFSQKANNMEAERFVPTVKELLGTAVVLGKCNIPYKVITPGSKLNGLSTIIINNAKYMSNDEVQQLRQFVTNGGTLIVTGRSSLCDLDNNCSGDFALADVFGVSYAGKTTPRISYLYDKDRGYLLSVEPAPLVHATTAKSLAKVALPYFDPDDVEHYASIHSNPPGDSTEYDALTVNEFGSGRCIYLFSSVLGIQQDAQQRFGGDLFKQYIRQNVVDSNAPSCVEVTLLKSRISPNRLLLCFVNWQAELPNIPVHCVAASIPLPEKAICQKCSSVSGEHNIEWQVNDGTLAINIQKLETAEFIEIELG